MLEVIEDDIHELIEHGFTTKDALYHLAEKCKDFINKIENKQDTDLPDAVRKALSCYKGAWASKYECCQYELQKQNTS